MERHFGLFGAEEGDDHPSGPDHVVDYRDYEFSDGQDADEGIEESIGEQEEEDGLMEEVASAFGEEEEYDEQIQEEASEFGDEEEDVELLVEVDGNSQVEVDEDIQDADEEVREESYANSDEDFDEDIQEEDAENSEDEEDDDYGDEEEEDDDDEEDGLITDDSVENHFDPDDILERVFGDRRHEVVADIRRRAQNNRGEIDRIINDFLEQLLRADGIEIPRDELEQGFEAYYQNLVNGVPPQEQWLGFGPPSAERRSFEE